MQHRVGDGLQRHSIFLQRDISGLDSLSEVPRLQLDLNDQRQLCVVHHGEKWPIHWPDANLPHNSLIRTAAAMFSPDPDDVLPTTNLDERIGKPSVMTCSLLGNWLKDSLWYHLLASGSTVKP
jgi:hypothetical protein